MTKIIHCIKVGPNSELGDFELSCVDTWKKVYPDFEIKYWTDKQILPLIQDCRYAVSYYNAGKFAFVTDYLRLKILYNEGGMYMDTDVFCVERVPDFCFDKTFTCWDPGFDTYWSLNGICLYSDPGDRIIKEMMEMYQRFDEYPFYTDNTSVETILRQHGIDFSDRLKCRFSNQEVDGDYRVYNCVQFGAWDHVLKQYNYLPDVPVYFVHCGTKSWVYKDENSYLFYAFLNDDTDLMKLSYAVDAYIEMEVPEGIKTGLVIAVNCINGNESIFSKRLWMKLGQNENKGWDIFPIGNGLKDDELNAAFLDFISRKFTRIKFCRNIMEGNFTGRIEV